MEREKDKEEHQREVFQRSERRVKQERVDYKRREESLRALWKGILPGAHVVLKSLGLTGEVKKVMPWGVEVWIRAYGMERQNWSWSMITKRNPRSIRRFPRPLRFPRLEPSKICHCKGGPMKVIPGANNVVQCQNKKCKFPIGFESFPTRIRRSVALLQEYYTKHPRGFAAKAKPPKPIAKRVVRSAKQKVARTTEAQRKKTPRGVGIRHSRSGKKATRTSKTKAIPEKPIASTPAIPVEGNPPVPTSEVISRDGEVPPESVVTEVVTKPILTKGQRRHAKKKAAKISPVQPTIEPLSADEEVFLLKHNVITAKADVMLIEESVVDVEEVPLQPEPQAIILCEMCSKADSVIVYDDLHLCGSCYKSVTGSEVPLKG